MPSNTQSRKTDGTPLPNFKKGDPVLHGRFNDIVKRVNSVTGGVNGPRQKTLDLPQHAIFQRFRISSIEADYLVCNPINTEDDSVTDAIVYVAKPPLLQNIESWNGITYTYADAQTRTATEGSDTEDQVVVPAYVEGDDIIAISNIICGTGVTREDGGDELQIEWMDINFDGRAWAKDDE